MISRYREKEEVHYKNSYIGGNEPFCYNENGRPRRTDGTESAILEEHRISRREEHGLSSREEPGTSRREQRGISRREELGSSRNEHGMPRIEEPATLKRFDSISTIV